MLLKRTEGSCTQLRSSVVQSLAKSKSENAVNTKMLYIKPAFQFTRRFVRFASAAVESWNEESVVNFGVQNWKNICLGQWTYPPRNCADKGSTHSVGERNGMKSPNLGDAVVGLNLQRLEMLTPLSRHLRRPASAANKLSEREYWTGSHNSLQDSLDRFILFSLTAWVWLITNAGFLTNYSQRAAPNYTYRMQSINQSINQLI
jgi:hypothetical protein